jgi:hypothetical protein
MAILLGGKAFDDYIERAVAAAGDHQLASFRGSSLRHGGGFARRSRFLKLHLYAALRQNAARFIEQATPAAPAVAGVRVMNQQSVAKARKH